MLERNILYYITIGIFFINISIYIILFYFNLEVNNCLLGVFISLISLIFAFLLYKYFLLKISLESQLEEKTKELNKLTSNLSKLVKKKVQENREKDIMIYEQAKGVQMGEMIGNIAHQWRQPLNSISLTASGIIVQKEMDILSDEAFEDSLKTIIDTTTHLSATIDVFRNFIKDDKIYRKQELQASIRDALNIVSIVLKDENIKLIDNVDYSNPIDLHMVTGELSHVIINIFNNAKDIIKEREIKDGEVEINLDIYNDKVVITIEDNAGGIPANILPKIFDPYFTTKHKSQGTGLGLHMSAKIIRTSLYGKMYAINTNKGAKFFIEIPLGINNDD